MIRRPLLILALVLGAGTTATGQSCNVNNPAGSCGVTVNVPSVTFPTVLKMTISSTSATLTPPALADFGPDSTATKTDANLTTVTARGNVGFHVTLRTTQPNFSATGSPPGPKVAGDLSWAPAVGGPYTPISTVTTTILTSAGASNGVTATLSFRTAWAFTQNTAGTYSLPLVFTLVSP